MNWLWLNIPLMAVFFIAVAGIPLWLVLRRPDFGHLQIEITVDDPKAYERPWTVTLNCNPSAPNSTLTITGTGFVAGATTVNVSGDGVTVTVVGCSARRTRTGT